MTKRTTLTLALGLWTTLAAAEAAPKSAAAPALPEEPTRTIESDISVGAALKARIDLTIGDVVVRGDDTDRIGVHLLVFCEKTTRDQKYCDEHARDLAIRGTSDGDGIKIGVDHVSQAVGRRLRLRLEVRVPKRLAVEVNVRDGQVRVDDLLASTKVDVETGTVDLTLPASEVGELDLKAGGKVVVEVGGETVTAKGTLLADLNWVRPGGLVHIKAGSSLGDVRVKLK